MRQYPGPRGDGPLAVEFHNTMYAARGTPVDGLADESMAASWIAAVADRLPDAAVGPVDDLASLHRLRIAVRDALHARMDRRQVDQSVLDELNAASAGAPGVVAVEVVGEGGLRSIQRYPGSPPHAVLRSAIARSTIELLSAEVGDRLRTCGAPGCVLMFVRDHPRRAWCSASCGNRARQARHQARRRRPAGTATAAVPGRRSGP
jgi:predicted RNA-binding Zn ribbon-like protein